MPIALSFVILSAILLSGCSRTFKDNFNKGIKPAWSPKTPEKWELGREGKDGFYRLKEPGKHDNGVRRPSEYSLIEGFIYTDFTFKCKLKCDSPTYRRYRDVVIIFGYQDDTHFYYVHFSNIGDDLHNAIMIVNGDYRRKLGKDVPEPTLIDLDFHKVMIKRSIKTGDIEVYFDEKMVMKAQDMTFTSGKIGVGSFDDMGSFDDIHIRGSVVE